MLESCSMLDEFLACLLYLINIYAFRCFSSECSIRDCLHERRSFYDFCSAYNTFVLISRCFHRDVRSEFVYIVDVSFIKTWWYVKQLHAKLSISFTFVNASVIISEIANFCFTIAHGTCSNERIKSFMYEFESRRQCLFLFQVREYASAQSLIDQTREFAHYQIIFIDDYVWCTIENNKKIIRKTVFFAFFWIRAMQFWFRSRMFATRSMISSETQSKAKTKSLVKLISRCQKSSEFFTSFDLKFIRTRNICFFVFVLKFIRTRSICFSWWSFVKFNFSVTWLLHRCLITSKWLEKSL